jgi:asparagine synthase (glutamine-hydrolysing)
MCGIAGIFSSGREISGSDIRQMCDILKHRGPDDEGYLFYRPKPKSLSLLHGSDSALREGADITNIGPVKDALLLGHRRLSIIDLSVAGHQPMLYGGNELAIIFNGEIYNYVELKEELIRKGHKFRTHTDTEVVLASYAEWGDRCLEKLNGMWSFVILDTKRNILFGARDRLGVKPFYYFNDNGIFAFASEIKALISLPFVGRQINEENLYDYLMWGDPENVHSTFFKSIYKLPHSNFFTFDLSSGNFTIEKYYELKYNKSLGIFKKEEYEHHCGNVRKIFFKAIDIRLRADVPVGSCLSGGIDSASIVTVISEILKAKNLSQVGDMQKVFTASFEGMPIDETKYACAVAGKTNSIWSRVSPASGELWEDLEKLVYMQDEPFNSTSVYAQYRVMKLAAENRVKVVLDGQGGDELFTGYAP